MSQKTNGETESIVEKKMRAVVEKIQQYDSKFGLCDVIVNSKDSEYLKLDEVALLKMTPEELAIGEFKLKAYSVAIQLAVNRASVVKNWAERALGLTIAKESKNYNQFMKYDTMRYLTMVNNEWGQALAKIIEDKQIFLDEMHFVSQAIKDVSDSLGRISKWKVKDR